MKITGFNSYQQLISNSSTLAQRPSATTASASGNQDNAKSQAIEEQVQRLKAVEEKVKAHESAHKAAGGALTGAVTYQYTTGPDGKRYITGGEVSISIQKGSTPEQTISNMEQVIRAALAPADPSPQDRAVAGEAAAAEQQAKQEESAAKSDEAQGKNKSSNASPSGTVRSASPSQAAAYQTIPSARTPSISLFA
jgi:hypothetical protein